MREILALQIPAMPLAQQNKSAAASTRKHGRVHIKYSITHNWCTDPGSYEKFPKRHPKSFRSVDAANEALEEVTRAKMREAVELDEDDSGEIEQFNAIADICELDKEADGDLFAWGHENLVQAYDESCSTGADGAQRCRVLYCDEYDDTVKVVAWVERDARG